MRQDSGAKAQSGPHTEGVQTSAWKSRGKLWALSYLPLPTPGCGWRRQLRRKQPENPKSPLIQS